MTMAFILPCDSPYFVIEEDIAKTQTFTPLKSIIFPMFATGHAGRNADDVIGPMLDGIKHWFSRSDTPSLEDIYISVYAKDHVEIVKSAMKNLVKKVTDSKSDKEFSAEIITQEEEEQSSTTNTSSQNGKKQQSVNTSANDKNSTV